MNKQVILIKDGGSVPGPELSETLSSAGIAIVTHTLAEVGALAELHHQQAPVPLAILYEVRSRATPQDLRSVVRRIRELWPDVSLVACRRQSPKSAASDPRLDKQALKRLGFRAVADSFPQLPALLRQVEEVVGTGELKLPEGFKPFPDGQDLALPKSVRQLHVRGAFALLASLHLASDQKEAGVAVLAGVARLVNADRWSIFLTGQDGTENLKFEPLASRSFARTRSLLFDQEWQSELRDDAGSTTDSASRATREAAIRNETIRQTEKGRRLIALPLLSGERVVGVLEGVRARSFSRSEADLLNTLTIPIAAALSNAVRIAEAERLSLTDDLTRLRNARYLRQFLVNEIKRARRYRTSVAALFLDLDDFKRINDLYGHLAGSHALMEVAAVMLPSVRDTDCVVRYGGDEFVLILTETGIDEALRVAERIRAKIEAHRFTGGRRLRFSLTASFGLAVFPVHALSPQQLISDADRAMYQAKAANKNCIRVTDSSEPINQDSHQESALPNPSNFQRVSGEKLIS